MTQFVEGKGWKKKIQCHNYGLHCMNNAVAEDGHHKWYCFSCFENMVDDIDDVEIDESLQVCHEELELQTK